MILVAILLGFFLMRIAKRKGKPSSVALFALIPVFNAFYALWLCSLPDEDLLKRIEALEKTQR